MSYDLLAIAVDLDRVRAAIGSNDMELLANLGDEFADDLQQTDELMEDTLNEDEGPFSATDALRDLITGGPYREDAGLAYYFCFEILCRHFGDTMPNDAWTSFKSMWLDVVEAGLEQVGVLRQTSLSLTNLVFRGPPVELPEPSEYPNLGYLTKAEVATARAALAKADLSKVKDKDVVAAIEQLRAWLDQCAKTGCDLVCTYA